jgi:hypothetical protein
MCQDMSVRGFYTYNKKELEAKKEYLDKLKFIYCKHMYQPEKLTSWTLDGLLERIHEVESRIGSGGHSYVEDPDLTCCGQGD